MFEQLLGAKPEDFFDFIDDAGFGLTYAGDQVSGGVIATVNDQAIATSRVGQLLGFIKLAGGLGGSSTGSQITTSETDHNGVKVTSITVAGSVPVGQPVTLQLALANNRLYLGMNDFVTAALDRSASDSLETNAKYESAIAAAPADNAGIVFVDVAAGPRQPAQGRLRVRLAGARDLGRRVRVLHIGSGTEPGDRALSCRHAAGRCAHQGL